MRVALISPLFESVPPRLYGGTERVVYNLCRGFTEANIEVALFASGDSSIEGRVVPVVPEALRLARRPIQDPHAYTLKMLAEVAEQAGDFDVIHNHHDYWMLPLSEMTDTPILTTTHGRLDFPDTAEAYSAFPRASFISISDAQRRPLPHLRWLKTIYHGIDVADFAFREKAGAYLAFLGRMDAQKRPDLAIRIAKAAGVPLKIAAKIEGPEGKSYYERLVKPHVDGRFIEYVGEISESEKSEFLGNALALCFPIEWPEPFGLVMIEALACGTPVLARPFGSVSEILRDGVTGYVDLDPEALTKRVAQLETVSRRGCRQWVEQRFSLTRMIEEYIHVYEYLRQHRLEFAAAKHRRRRHFVYPVERLADGNS